MFFDRFKKLCDERGISCSRAALEMGFSNSIATKWKKTGATPDTQTLAAVSKFFDVSIAYLIGDTDSVEDRSKTHWAEFCENDEPEITTYSFIRLKSFVKKFLELDPEKQDKIMAVCYAMYEDDFSDDDSAKGDGNVQDAKTEKTKQSVEAK